MEKIVILEQDIHKRLDILLSDKTGISRARIQNIIKAKLVKQEGKILEKASLKVSPGIIEFFNPAPKEAKIEAENIPLKILYQDKDIAVLDKEAGMTVHIGAGHSNGTLVNALLFHLKDLSGIGGELRPGIVHRLDKDTSGLMVIAKNDKSHLNLSKQFKERNVSKEYYALVRGLPKDKDRIESLIDRDKRNRKRMAVSFTGRLALTEYKTIMRAKVSLLEVKIETGRTHQIRVHLSHRGLPILGDAIYGKKEGYDRHFLHCYRLSFLHPSTNQECEFKTDIPEDFKRVMEESNEG